MTDDLTTVSLVPGDKKQDSMAERRAVAWKDPLHGTGAQRLLGADGAAVHRGKHPPRLQPKHKQHPILPQKMKPAGH